MDPATLEGLIVREIRRAGILSRRELADRLDIARSTAGRRVDSLIERDLVRESGIEARAEAGRPRRMLALDGDYGGFVGFDFDARHLLAAVTDFTGAPVARERFPLPPAPTRAAVLATLRDALARLRDRAPRARALGIGMGVPGRIRRAERLAIGYPFIRDWENVDLPAELGAPRERVHIENNTRTIALGEYWLGNPPKVEDLVCLSIRTGISAAVIADGRLLRGRHEMAGEIRGWTVSGKEREAAPHADSSWLEEAATIRAVCAPDEETPSTETWRRFVAGCREGDAAALDRLASIAGHHADATTRIVQLTDPEIVVISGAFNELGDLYLDRVRAAAQSALEGHYFGAPPIRFVSGGEFTGAHGAAALAAAHYRPG